LGYSPLCSCVARSFTLTLTSAACFFCSRVRCVSLENPGVIGTPCAVSGFEISFFSYFHVEEENFIFPFYSTQAPSAKGSFMIFPGRMRETIRPFLIFTTPLTIVLVQVLLLFSEFFFLPFFYTACVPLRSFAPPIYHKIASLLTRFSFSCRDLFLALVPLRIGFFGC